MIILKIIGVIVCLVACAFILDKIIETKNH